VQILGIEEFFEMPFDEDVPPFQGYIDLIEQSAEGVVSVVDLKTAARKPTKAQAGSNLQLTAYTLGAEALGFDPDQLNLRLDVLTKTKNPELVRYETTRSTGKRAIRQTGEARVGSHRIARCSSLVRIGSALSVRGPKPVKSGKGDDHGKEREHTR
jgi:RecB family exonuclease